MPLESPVNSPAPDYNLIVTVQRAGSPYPAYLSGVAKLSLNYEDGSLESTGDDMFQDLIDLLNSVSGISAEGYKNLGTVQEVTPT